MKKLILYQRRALAFGNMKKHIFLFFILFALVFKPFPVYSHDKHEGDFGGSVNPAKSQKDFLRLGSTVYKHMCVYCHGQDGNGGGKAMALHNDGVGTKVLIAQMMEKFNTVGIDCVAMNVNDLICIVAKPIALLDYLVLKKADSKLMNNIIIYINYLNRLFLLNIK